MKETFCPWGPRKKGFVTDPTMPYTPERLGREAEKICKRYPALMKMSILGKSPLGYPIPLVTLGCGKRKILAVAGVHGREYVTVGYLLRCLEEYAEAADKNRLYGGFPIRKILCETTFYCVPLANPDGTAIALGERIPPKGYRGEAKLFKNNSRNVNLNANFPFMWKKVSRERLGGQKAASETETKILMQLCEDNSFEMLLSFHCRGGTIYWRDEENGEISCDEEISRRLSLLCGYSLEDVSRDESLYSGGFENWFRGRFGRVGLCVELVKEETADFYDICRDFYEAVDFVNTRLTLAVAAT